MNYDLYDGCFFQIKMHMIDLWLEKTETYGSGLFSFEKLLEVESCFIQERPQGYKTPRLFRTEALFLFTLTVVVSFFFKFKYDLVPPDDNRHFH